MKPQGSQGCNAVYYLILTVLAQDLPVSTLSGIGGAFSTLLCIAGCCSICCYWYFKSDPRYTRRAAHANRNRRLTSHRSHPSMVTYDQRSQKGVEPHSRGNTAAPHASASGHPQVPIYAPAPPQYELSVYNSAAPPPYLSIPPPYTAQLVQHSQVHTTDSGAEVRAEPALHAVSGSEVNNEVESGAQVQAVLHAASNGSEVHTEVENGAEVQAEPILHAASNGSEVYIEVENGAEVQGEHILHAASNDSEVHIEVENGAEVQAEHILHAASDSYSRNVGESVEVQAQSIPHDASSFETPKVENQEMQLISSPRPELEIQMAKMDFQADDDEEESSVFANPCT